ncbi:monovalent cation/H(+) antiporter subunit G [Sorangium sp. So ce1335]|uniref:monovalent cation/H(+) antiporter subunit G n=1 Tax=Sorangium sp. So ce1335 TaxID=3133335 RepID=UPI003F625F09
MIDGLVLASVIIGVFFMFVASLGVLRLPEFTQRIHAPTKAATLGLLFLLLALSLSAREGPVVTKALLALLFIGTTAPVGAHILARAGRRQGAARPPEPPEPPETEAEQNRPTE